MTVTVDFFECEVGGDVGEAGAIGREEFVTTKLLLPE